MIKIRLTYDEKNFIITTGVKFLLLMGFVISIALLVIAYFL